VNSKTQSLLVGGLIGALLGAFAGWLYYNSNVNVSEEGVEQLEAPTPVTSLKLGLSMLGVLRQIAER
jgi:CDP-diglyceride synthetase